MIEFNIKVRNSKRGLSTFDEIDLADTVADFMGVDFEDVELDWDFEDDEEEKE